MPVDSATSLFWWVSWDFTYFSVGLFYGTRSNIVSHLLGAWIVLSDNVSNDLTSFTENYKEN